MDKRRAMMEDYRRYRDEAVKIYQEQKSIRLGLRGGGIAHNPTHACSLYHEMLLTVSSVLQVWIPMNWTVM